MLPRKVVYYFFFLSLNALPVATIADEVDSEHGRTREIFKDNITPALIREQGDLITAFFDNPGPIDYQHWMVDYNGVCLEQWLDVETSAQEEEPVLELSQSYGRTITRCLETILEGLNLEKSQREENESEDDDVSIPYLNRDIAKLEEMLQTMPDTGEIPGSPGDIRAQVENEQQAERLSRIFSEDTWYSAFHIGTMMMPEYNELGENQGFRESKFFARMQLDSRYVFRERDSSKWLQWRPTALHSGLTLDFFSGNVLNCANVPAGEERDNCESDTPDLSNLGFNDVSDTLKANIYGWFTMLQPTQASEIALGFEWGFQSREQLKENGDSINEYRSWGIRYMGNDFNEAGNNNRYKNGVPRFFLEFSKAWYEDYAGLGAQRRIVSTMAYRIKKDSPIYLGLTVNAGDGEDQIALTLTYGLKVDTILDLFGQ